VKEWCVYDIFTVTLQGAMDVFMYSVLGVGEFRTVFSYGAIDAQACIKSLPSRFIVHSDL
jgi:hypothetical protein